MATPMAKMYAAMADASMVAHRPRCPYLRGTRSCEDTTSGRFVSRTSMSRKVVSRTQASRRRTPQMASPQVPVQGR
jgi:hypothetical protein